MRTIKGTVLALIISVIFAIQSLAVVDQAIEVEGTNIVLSWPSQGYEYYMIQYWPDLQSPPIQLTNGVPANSTNRTTFVIPCCTMAALGGGDSTNSGGNLFPGLPLSESMSEESGSELWVVQSDGSELPFNLYPPGIDTNGMIFTDTPPDGQSETVASFTASFFANGAETPDGITNGGCDCPAQGFFRVWHIPDFPASITNYTFDGPTFIPIDFKDYMDRVKEIQVLIDGQVTDLADFTSDYYNSVTNWGMGIYFDRLTNGTHQIQLITTLQLDDNADGTDFMVLSNLTRSITVDNQVVYPDWDDMVWNNTNYTFRAQTKNLDTDWDIDIYDADGYWVNGTSGHTTNGQIEATWDLTDYLGNPRDDIDSDPYFWPTITFDTTAGGGMVPAVQTTRYTPTVVLSYPTSGDWLIAYMSEFYQTGTQSHGYMVDAMNAIGGWIDYRGVPFSIFPMAYGTNLYTQVDRDADWATLKSVLQHPDYRNFYYFGHGNPASIGGDYTMYDANGVGTNGANAPNTKAYLTSHITKSEITFNKNTGTHYYRLVFLDGCSTAAGSWPDAFGVNSGTNSYGYYTNNVSNPSHKRPSAFVGWMAPVGGAGWGTVQTDFLWKSQWAEEWSYNSNTETLVQALSDAANDSTWPPGQQSQLWSILRVYGYQDLRMNQYNQKTDWPGP
ncbi:MAG TPA: hypothetical protein VG938_18800 [Verrucomicrobiae bacterium]|jgi:hypothetical protein|nr:hypothetical protein [Verrucomicrobiae bacterium]